MYSMMASKFLSPQAQFDAGINGCVDETDGGVRNQPVAADPPAPKPSVVATPFSTIQNQEDAPPCSTCGAIMIRSGACYKCVNCGNTSGCA